jgi:hypothetical protein
MGGPAMARRCLVALGAAIVLLVLAPSAWAGGTWSSTDFTNINVQWSNDSGAPVFFTVFTLTKQVQSAKTSDGRDCFVGQPDNNPNQVECPVSQATSGAATIVTKEAIACADAIQHKVSEDNRTYVARNDIRSANACGGGGPPQPCKCASVTPFLNKFGVFGAGTTRIQFEVHAALACTAGTGAGCKGRIKVLGPKGSKFVKPGTGKIIDLNCAGPCNAVTKLHRTMQYTAFVKKGKRTVPNPRFLPEGRANKDFKIKLSVSCISPTGVPGAPRVVTMTVHFNKRGYVDYKKSDLNGDGKDDGGQLK